MIPSNQDFASEVKADRLTMLWRVALTASIIIGWLVLNVSVLQRADAVMALSPFVVIIIGSLATQALLRMQRYTGAAWAFTLGGLGALGSGLLVGSPQMLQILPFAFPVIVFVVGMLLPPGSTLAAAVLSVIITVVVPAVQTGGMAYFGPFQLGAIVLVVVSALLAIQVTGDLYQVTAWALQNYQRERRVSGELYNNRQELQRSLVRSEALSESLQDANAQLEAARTAAEDAKHFRGQFLANMSHELRTPLNAIIGFSETMLKFPEMYENVHLPDAYEDDLQQIYSSGRQLLNLINDILDLSKVDAGKLDVRMDKVELTSVIGSVLSTASGLIGTKPIRLETDLPEKLPPVWADRARVSQVLLNLYSNAAKFTDKGYIRLRLRELDNWVQVSITDSGIGIAPENAEVIFEEFKQAETGKRDPRAGAGLGLAISRQLLLLMGGHIWVESELGKGSTFHLTLQPFHEEESGRSEGEDGAAETSTVSEPVQEKVG
jgi:signal transduction histidine kinase